MNQTLRSSDLNAAADNEAAPSPLFQTRVDERGTGRASEGDDVVAEEIPVAMVYNGISHAVMMATPVDLEDFALGFSLSETIVRSLDEVYELELDYGPDGVTAEMTIATERLFALKEQRRNMAGRTGCGLCGTESLAHAIRKIPKVGAHPAISDQAIQAALTELKQHQPLQAQTGATHAAAWCGVDGSIIAVREDVGRHNALDKLIGHRRRTGNTFESGFALISSRASFEMVQKSATVGIGCLVAVSAPTGLAIREARKADMSLIGFARPGRHVIYHQGQTTHIVEAVQENKT
ncbi:formate dehydrogenase accessory sulfurtransferase FdhD [Marinobacter nanhaiticus D15-8W]|uniref:Sulfur carrier protein FdhD n=1 Tax=Marinobacter nanhaiticus D15-8W TaxID=626887 RepID=N6WUT9_9GAMM|nr:formate dehydrogenase accessory sulfurtransferase FdhD [Marinobacter nanhaiticus]ENO14762.2 formate dehydrogenase accessory sulfurtransferase FdhD [Marinobacter nanhaiticus D15-8W]BES69550.1 formate dehydrogenase accessory sulfurtransferase FdhD [Marinobacter nanhaiticus D15-8W]